MYIMSRRIKSNLAQEIFRQDLLQVYQKQSDIRDDLRQESRERITEIVDAINYGSFDNPQMQMMLVQLADRLAKAKGKKQYGYLNADTKKLVDAIVAELAGDGRIRELYSLWYEQKEDVLRTYTNKMPERIPLEQEKEFRTIRNAVVQAALQLRLPHEELPLSDRVPPRVDLVDDGSDVHPKAVESLREPEVEPNPEAKQFLHEAAIRGRVAPGIPSGSKGHRGLRNVLHRTGNRSAPGRTAGSQVERHRLEERHHQSAAADRQGRWQNRGVAAENQEFLPGSEHLAPGN